MIHRCINMDAWHRLKYENVSSTKLPTLPPLTFLVEDFPTGFPRLACFLDSDDAFMLYRRFGSVYSRLLLRKQDEMRRIESTLQSMDKTDAEEGHGEYLMSHVLDDEREHIPTTWPESRAELMDKLERKALNYGIKHLPLQ